MNSSSPANTDKIIKTIVLKRRNSATHVDQDHAFKKAEQIRNQNQHHTRIYFSTAANYHSEEQEKENDNEEATMTICTDIYLANGL